MLALSKKGFTVTEILIVVSILIVVASLLFSAFTSFNKVAAVNASVQVVLSALEEARTNTLSSKNENVYGVHFATTSVVVFVGSTYDQADPLNEIKSLPSTVEVSSVQVLGGGVDVVFDRLRGTVGQSGTITLSSLTSDVTRVITVEVTGVAHE